MLCDLLAYKAEKAGDKDKQARYEKLSQDYAAKMESLFGHHRR